MFNFKPDRVNWNERIGGGAFGKVYPYQKDPSDTKWVVKNIITKEVEEVLQCFQEITIGFSCNNPHVLPVKGYYIDYNKNKKDWDIYIKFPRLKSSLRDVLNESKSNKIMIPEKNIVQYFYDIIQGLEYLHEKGIAHRDIKPDNILIGENGDIKIADFGLGSFHGGDTSYALAERAGTIFYAAPENRDPSAELTKQHLLKADLWSLGILMYELCSLEELRQINFYAAGEKAEEDINIKLQEMNGKYSKQLISLIGSLLRYKPSERKSLKDLREELVAIYGDSLKMNKSNKSVQTDLERLDLKVEPNKMLSEKEESQEDYRKEEKEQIKILSEKEESYDFDDTIKMEEELNRMETYYKAIISTHEESFSEYESRIEELQKELEEAKEAHKKTQELYTHGEMDEIYKTLVLFPKYFDPVMKYNKSELPSGATLDYATSLDDSEYQNSLAFLEMMEGDLKKARVHPYLEEKSDKGKIVQKKLQKVQARIRQMETAFEDKRMDRPKYIENLKKSIVHDRELCKLYIKKQDNYREKFMLKKIKITQNEIEELEKFPVGKSGIFLLSTCGPKQEFTEVELPSGMTLKQATNLDDVDFYCSLSFLKMVADDLKKVGLINGILGQKVLQRIRQIEAQFASGALDKLVYLQLLKKSIIQDEELSKLYSRKKDKIRADFTLERAKHEQKEATELEKSFKEQTMLISLLIAESLTTTKTDLLEYANQPLDINSHNCLSFLKIMADDLNKVGLINGKYGRKVTQKIKSIETQLASGALDKIEYMQLLAKSIRSDQDLYKGWYRTIAGTIKAKFILEKIRQQEKEIKDISGDFQSVYFSQVINGFFETIKNELPKSAIDPYDPEFYNFVSYLKAISESLNKAGLMNTKYGQKVSQRLKYIEAALNKTSGKLELLHLLRRSIDADQLLIKDLIRIKQKSTARFVLQKLKQEQIEAKELQESLEKETSIFVPEYYYWSESKLSESELPPNIKLAYATEPDNSDFHNGLSFLKMMADETENIRVSLVGLDPNKDLAQLMLLKKQKVLQRIKEIEVQLEKDTFYRLEYLKGLKASVVQDQELCNLYIAKNQQAREKFLIRKIKQTQEEIELTEKVEDRLKKI